MPKSLKRSIKNTKTLTRKYNKDGCPIGLKPFEKMFTKKNPCGNSHVDHMRKMKILSKELLSKFAPNSIKPENDFYDYINYQWLKDISVEKQQDYLTQIDDFRLC